jgi:uncharacterized protein YbjT (DUF2867 family)
MLPMTNDTSTTAPTLVVGGTGKVGRRVAERLTRRGIGVRVAARSAPQPFDWDDRATWSPALTGVAAAYVAFAPDLAIPGAAETISAFSALAAEHGVARLVLLSGRGEEEAERSERAALASGVAAVSIVRASWFSQNFSESFLLDAVLGGTVALPVDGVGEPFVDAGDIADVAVAALTEDGHAGVVHEVTGPRLLSFAEAVGEIARAAGRDVRFVSVPLADYAAELAGQQVPADVVALLIYLLSEVLDGRNASTTDGVQRALGRPPRDFAAYARETAATGVWAHA